MQDHTKLGFADDLALVAGLEEVIRTCCPHINLITWFYHRDTIIGDTIIGQGDTDKKADLDHYQNLRNLLDRFRASNIKLNKKKFHLKSSSLGM